MRKTPFVMKGVFLNLIKIWKKGVFHETIAVTDMIAIVIEGEGLTPEEFMPLL